MKALAIIDKKNRVQHYRISILEKITDIDFNICTVKDNIKKAQKQANRSDFIYYASAGLYAGFPLKHNNVLGSITSHKEVSCLDKFKKLSVNNKFLYDEYKKKLKAEKVYYIPNGVDTSFFRFVDKPLSCPLVVGWVGNTDRAVKNFDIARNIRDKGVDGIEFNFVETRKSQPANLLLTQEQMREYYYGLHFLLVTSSNEGTPNPALEAASCGVPLITTLVGNMPEIVNGSPVGYIIDCYEESVRRILGQIKKLGKENYSQMRNNISCMIRDAWDWEHRKRYWKEFFLL